MELMREGAVDAQAGMAWSRTEDAMDRGSETSAAGSMPASMLSRVEAAMALPPLEHASRKSVAKVKLAFTVQYARKAVARLAGKLVLDTNDPVLFPVRDRGICPRRLQRFEAGSYMVDLFSEEDAPGMWAVIGAVFDTSGLGNVVPAVDARLAHRGRLSLPADCGHTGFTIQSVPAGTYDMRVRLPDAEVLVQSVQIGA